MRIAGLRLLSGMVRRAGGGARFSRGWRPGPPAVRGREDVGTRRAAPDGSTRRTAGGGCKLARDRPSAGFVAAKFENDGRREGRPRASA